MTASIEKLRRFFWLEAERDYDNRAVVGGLENMLETWEAEARADEIDEKLVNAIIARLRDYGRLSTDGRAEALEGLWKRIQRELNIEDDKTNPPTKLSKKPRVDKPKKAEDHQTAKPSKTKPSLEIPKAQPIDGPPAALEAAVTVLDGVGPTNAERLEKLGIRTLRDMLYHFPRRHDDYTRLLPIHRLQYGQDVTVIGTVRTTGVRSTRNKAKIAEAVVDDGTATLRVSWFNQPWATKDLNEGDQVVLSGTIDQYLGRLTMSNPELEMLEAEHLHTNRIVPIYPLTAKISQRWLRGMMNKVVNYWAPRVQETLPEGLREKAELFPLSHALLQTHFPDSWENLEAAQQRLAFDELFLMQLAVLQQKQDWQGQEARRFNTDAEWLNAQLSALPFQLTKAQQGALGDIQGDLASGRPMNRLIQGDVGSGKTVVAGLALAIIANAGAQSAIMAPTSILAEQHFRNLQTFLAGEGKPLNEAEIQLMIGATPEAEKKRIRQGLRDGDIKVVIGTHTLIEDPVVFSELELVVIDEQHRFGVQQRAALRGKGSNPHLLVMTATPIPRSLALTLYGDLDLSVIDELPPGRQEVGTYILFPRERERAYGLIRNELEAGRQVFLVYPLVEENESSQAKAAVEEHAKLKQDVFPNYDVLLLHGRLTPGEKEDVMARFRDGEGQVLVSTTVVEVGVDVANASVMLIEGANRFGLAQLHQLRGRVGRGTDKAYCILIPDHEDAAENERLKAMTETNDGFLLAERDLEQRGPGEFLGTRQSGFDDLRLASLTDARMIDKARRFAADVLDDDPQLSNPEHKALQVALARYWSNGTGDLS
ncbi:MAG: ATP-dependent DNA helicase RecG [Chloroflexi bacterium]|nr:ATP-dependent DNA helicase RecG [Chloroflexota bacterium]MQC26016.1 ATP-dependent DNA helicase RecG [Chloroflexota bacterium]